MPDKNERAWETIFNAAQSSIAIGAQRNAAADMLEEIYADESALLVVADLLRGKPFRFPKKWETKAHEAVKYLHDVEGESLECAYAEVAAEVNKSPQAVRDARRKCLLIESSSSEFLKRLSRP